MNRMTLVLAAASIVGCSRSKEEAPPATKTTAPAAVMADAAAAVPAVSWYRVEVIADAATSIPFFIGVDAKAGRATINNGDENLDAVLVSREPIKVRVPVLGGEVTLAPDKGGAFRGEWTAKSIIKEPFRVEATRVDAPSPRARFVGDEAPAGSIAGEWKIELKDFGNGRAIFEQDAAGNVSGSVIPPEVGDSRYLSGRVIGNRFLVSTFDGMHAYLFEGTIEEEGKRLSGRWVAAGLGEWQMTATRGAMPSALGLVTARMKKGQTRLSIPALAKPPFKGEPVIVDFFGTWCSACLDAMPELVSLEKKYRDRGLKILMIALEPGDDETDGRRRIEELRTKYGITWDIDARFSEDLLADIPRELDNALGFPLTIFVRRDGTVAGIHSAFISPAAGSANTELRERFDALTKEIVESPPPKAGKTGKK